MSSRMYPHLEQFLGGYFHQDWTLEASQSTEVIHRYLSTAPAELIQSLLSETRALMGERLNESMLHQRLHELGSSFEPAGEKTTSSAWLKKLEQSLVEAGHRKQKP